MIVVVAVPVPMVMSVAMVVPVPVGVVISVGVVVPVPVGMVMSVAMSVAVWMSLGEVLRLRPVARAG